MLIKSHVAINIQQIYADNAEQIAQFTRSHKSRYPLAQTRAAVLQVLQTAG